MRSSRKLILGVLALAASLALMISSASAFPLSGGNGLTNVTVLGTYTSESCSEDSGSRPCVISVDLLFDFGDIPSVTRSVMDDMSVQMVDSDDRFYSGRLAYPYSGVVQPLEPYETDNKVRRTYSFSVPSDKIEVKRLRVNPAEQFINKVGPPFSIDWTGVPEVKGMPISMKFYSIERKEGADHQAYLSADIKITNNNPTELVISCSQFAIVDQFGLPAKAQPIIDSDMRSSFGSVTLLPEESMRASLWFMVPKLSRPVYLKYLPSDLSMDVSAWA